MDNIKIYKLSLVINNSKHKAITSIEKHKVVILDIDVNVLVSYYIGTIMKFIKICNDLKVVGVVVGNNLSLTALEMYKFNINSFLTIEEGKKWIQSWQS